MSTIRPAPYSQVEFFVDLDKVLVDFDKEFQKHMPGVTEDDDWQWQDLHKMCPDIYAIADPMPDAFELYEYLVKTGPVKILTAIPRRWNWPNVTQHKRQWVVNHFNMDPVSVKFGPYAEDKQFHCQHSWQILIDDKVRNIEQWRSRGGIGIVHTTAKSTIDTLKYMGYFPTNWVR